MLVESALSALNAISPSCHSQAAKRDGHTTIAAARRTYAGPPAAAVALVLSGRSSSR
ncbi:MAG: hypothetical protein ACRDI2_18000 [Chloroflexota bacterium]